MTTLGGGAGKNSTFSRIAAGELPARFESDDPALPVVCFHNRLKWERVMLLVVPRLFITQEQLWTGEVLVDALRLAVEMGERHCPEGFRVLSNFGKAAHQSQLHAHVHVISGLADNVARSTADGETEQRGAVTVQRAIVEDTPHADVYRARAARSQYELLTGDGVKDVAREAVGHAKSFSQAGFRLLANYRTDEPGARGGPQGLFLLGGGQLKLYV